MNAKTRTALIKARERIEKGWCRDEWAVDDKGMFESPESPSAAAWCVLGACGGTQSAFNGTDTAIDNVLRAAGLVGGPLNFNDAASTTKDDVLGLLDLAIAGVE